MTVTVNKFGQDLEQTDLAECVANLAEVRTAARDVAGMGQGLDGEEDTVTADVAMFKPLPQEDIELKDVKLASQHYVACSKALQFLKGAIESDMYDIAQAELDMNAANRSLISMRSTHQDNPSWGNFSGSVFNTVLSDENTENWGGEKKSDIYTKKITDTEQATKEGVLKRVQLSTRVQMFSYLGVLLAHSMCEFVAAKGLFASIGNALFGSGKCDNVKIEGWMQTKFKAAQALQASAVSIQIEGFVVPGHDFTQTDNGSADRVTELFAQACDIGNKKVTNVEAVKNSINSCVGKLSFSGDSATANSETQNPPAPGTNS